MKKRSKWPLKLWKVFINNGNRLDAVTVYNDLWQHCLDWGCFERYLLSAAHWCDMLHKYHRFCDYTTRMYGLSLLDITIRYLSYSIKTVWMSY